MSLSKIVQIDREKKAQTVECKMKETTKWGYFKTTAV